MIQRLPRAVWDPVLVTAALMALAVVAPFMRDGWLLTWLLLGLVAGYALSGSA